MAVAATDAAADPVVDAFYNRCVSENAYQMAPNELEGACACMAPVMVSFLTDDARRQVEEAIKNNAPVSLGAQPVQGQSRRPGPQRDPAMPERRKGDVRPEMRRRQRGRAAVPRNEGHDRSGPISRAQFKHAIYSLQPVEPRLNLT